MGATVPLKLVVPPDRVMALALRTLGAKVAAPPLVTMAPVWVKFTAPTLSEPLLVSSVPALETVPEERFTVPPAVWRVPPLAMPRLPELVSVPPLTLSVPPEEMVTFAMSMLPAPRL